MSRIHFKAGLLGLALTWGMAEPCLAQGRQTSASVDMARTATALAPGEWVWAPSVAPAGPILIYVDLSTQTVTIYRNGVRIGVSTISSGRAGHETPTGVFSILQKDARHHSTTYNNAPMPYMERLTWDGVALHAGGLPGYPESHGCIHLPLEFARLLYGLTDFSATVVIAGDAARHVGDVPAGVTSPFTHDGRPNEAAHLDADWEWLPEKSTSGPTTVILSKSDQTALVLRNGVEIGRSPIKLDDHDGEVHVLTLAREADGRLRWIYAGLPGRSGEEGQEPGAAIVGRLHAPRTFYDLVRASLQPGDTVLVTPAPLDGAGTGRRITIMDATPVG